MLTLNKFNNEVEFFALRPFTRLGVAYTKGQAITAARTWKNLETLVTRKYIVAVTADRNLLPKMFLREVRSVHYVTVKYGFTPSLANDYDPGSYLGPAVIAYATAHPSQISDILAEEIADKNRSTVVTALQAMLPHITSVSPTSGGVDTVVTATGTGFTGATVMRFYITSGSSANGGSFVLTSSTSAHATVPSLLGGIYNVELNPTTGTIVKTNAFTIG